MENTESSDNSGKQPRMNCLRGPNEKPQSKVMLERDLVREQENKQSMEITAELEKLIKRTGMPVTQENGQRTYGPPKDWDGVPPPKGCEVFVGKLPRSVYEPHLVPLFEKCGPIHELRLMMDFSGENRGFCFVQYTKPADAQQAISQLNDYEIRKGRKIGVVKSMDNCRLFIGGIPTDKTEKDIFREMHKNTGGVSRVIVYATPSPGDDKPKNRGFAFVEYDSHKAAAMARRKLIPGKIPLWGNSDVTVDWAEPEPEVKILYVSSLPSTATEESLEVLFNQASNNGVEKIEKKKDFAFIHFMSREQADSAKREMNDKEIDGSCIRVVWAKQTQSQSNSNNSSPSRICKSNGRIIQENVSPKRGDIGNKANMPNRTFRPPPIPVPMQYGPPSPFCLPPPGDLNQFFYQSPNMPSHMMQQQPFPPFVHRNVGILHDRQQMMSSCFQKPALNFQFQQKFWEC